MSSLPILYTKKGENKLAFWHVEAVANEVVVQWGELGGKIQKKVYEASPKNEGKANATTAEEQAVLEAKAKWVKQKKDGYFETKEEALAYIDMKPSKAQNYNHHSKKIVYPAHISAKLDGFRCMVSYDGRAYSKAGEAYTLPEHIQRELDAIQKLMGDDFVGLDGEIYAGLGVLSLQQISSAFRKHNDNTPLLKYYIYDVPDSTEKFWGRWESIKKVVQGYNNVILVEGTVVKDEETGDVWYDSFVKAGYEGAVYRNLEAKYEFGKRSYNMQKRKPRQDIEARVVSVKEDKNGQGVLSCVLESGAEVDCLMLKDADENTNYRLYKNALTLPEKYITIQFEDYSDDDVPLKPVGIKIREVEVVNGKWEVKE